MQKIDFTSEEAALLISALLAAGLKNPQAHEATVNSILAKLGLTEAAAEMFAHYWRRSQGQG